MVSNSTHSGSLVLLRLHGNLDIWVNEAKNLPNMDKFHKALGDVFGRFSGKVSNKVDGHMPRKITSDPYVTITVASAVIGRTFVINNTENPIWMQHFCVPVAHRAAEVHFIVKDDDVVGSEVMGSVDISVERLQSGELIEGSFPVLTQNGKPCKEGAVLILSIQYTPIEQVNMYKQGVGAGPRYIGVPCTYFPLRKGGQVTLYQDAHVVYGSLPELKLGNKMQYHHNKCWHDIYDAISKSSRLIYITGWSVYHLVSLVRDPENASSLSLGELPKRKSQDGARVLLLVWDDPTSKSILGYKTEAEAIYTHHQKTVIVDVDAGDRKRKIVAFVGGLDLCKGRYDTPGHSIYRTLKTVHSDDFHNPNFTGATDGCPREPWHDLHSRIDGPAAYDVLANFEDRWSRASVRTGINKFKASTEDALLNLNRIPDIHKIADAPYLREDHPESWHVQVFRSIDSNSVKGFPEDPMDATKMNLVCGKNVLIDMSIHTAYVKAIRAAQHFIYIENQYFIGSSFNWNAHKELGANNLIPLEIALKIANKIRARERFSAYILVPMWPEGVPTSRPTQRILYWQNQTMIMMYEIIFKALQETGLDKEFEPQDYLLFFCLGNREEADPGDNTGSASCHAANSPQGLAQKNRRFMIYVHSKGMIVDDEYVIWGSANINQRSMEGSRDTEIAMGAYQPKHTWANKRSYPHGQVHGYRMSLWLEHTGAIKKFYKQPESVECIRQMRILSEHNWRQYVSDEVTNMNGHLLKYPVKIDQTGKVSPLPGCETFPDMGGNVTGTYIPIKENLTT
ncbi:unnamed protein product [Rhodiola kirilowii]